MQGIFAGRTQLRYPYGRYGYTRGGGKIWHGGMDLVGLDSTDIRMPYYKNKRITGKVIRARRVADHVVMMDQGRVIEQGTPEALFERPRQQRTADFLAKTL